MGDPFWGGAGGGILYPKFDIASKADVRSSGGKPSLQILRKGRWSFHSVSFRRRVEYPMSA